MRFTVKFSFGITPLLATISSALAATVQAKAQQEQARYDADRDEAARWYADQDKERELRREVLHRIVDIAPTLLRGYRTWPDTTESRAPSAAGAESLHTSQAAYTPQDAHGEEAPTKPPFVASPDDAPDLAAGQDAFINFVRTWAQNFGVDNAPQPDRPAALMGVASGYGRVVTQYIRERGGLAGAILDVLVLTNMCAVEDAGLLARKMALNMVQVGSLLAVPLDRLIERSLLTYRATTLTDEELRDVPLRGGPAGDTLNFDDRPSGA